MLQSRRRRDRRPGLEHRVDALGVDPVGVVDDVDARARTLEDRDARRAVRAHELAVVVRDADHRVDLGARQITDVAHRRRSVARRRGDLDHVAAASDLLARRLAEFLRAVEPPREAGVLDAHEPGAVGAVGHVARGHELVAARGDPRPVDDPEDHRLAQTYVEVVAVARADHAGDAASRARSARCARRSCPCRAAPPRGRGSGPRRT